MFYDVFHKEKDISITRWYLKENRLNTVNYKQYDNSNKFKVSDRCEN